MKHHLKAVAVAGSVALALSLTACGGGDEGSSGEATGSGDGKVKLVMSAWNTQSTPEFQTLADEFMKRNENVEITVTDYPAKDYDTLLTTDLSSGKGPDVFPVKNMRKFNYYQENGQLNDLTAEAGAYLDDKAINLSYFEVDGKYYGLPFRQDNEVVFYNKSLFDKAGMEYPDGKWTWDDYIKMSKELTEKLAAAGETAKGSYLHTWPIMDGFALVQSPDADPFTGNLDYLKPYYEIALKLQEDGSQESFATAQSQQLTYQAQFGTEKAAMMAMGTWYIGTLVKQQGNGDAHQFEWGVAPAPQRDASTLDNPITYGISTPMAVNPNISPEKLKVAHEFASFCASEDASVALAEKGIIPGYLSDKVMDTLFSIEGMPTDDLTRFAVNGQTVKPEYPIHPDTGTLTQILEDYYGSVMTGDKSIDEALQAAKADLEAAGVVRK